jgi:predicted DNA-binding ribbon-helix-helix protein
VQRELKKSSIVKGSVVVDGRKTSISLEVAFWTSLKEIAIEREVSVSALVSQIDADREVGNLSSAVRLFVLGFYQDQFRQAVGSRRR